MGHTVDAWMQIPSGNCASVPQHFLRQLLRKAEATATNSSFNRERSLLPLWPPPVFWGGGGEGQPQVAVFVQHVVAGAGFRGSARVWTGPQECSPRGLHAAVAQEGAHTAVVSMCMNMQPRC
mmetsp:Transcript_78914/g.183043  ORF Transcript_78914/g.183043 Transcript_78914/m.183043 type:complete len:122 (+) Transcript_78914:139-504(+)